MIDNFKVNLHLEQYQTNFSELIQKKEAQLKEKVVNVLKRKQKREALQQEDLKRKLDHKKQIQKRISKSEDIRNKNLKLQKKKLHQKHKYGEEIRKNTEKAKEIFLNQCWIKSKNFLLTTSPVKDSFSCKTVQKKMKKQKSIKDVSFDSSNIEMDEMNGCLQQNNNNQEIESTKKVNLPSRLSPCIKRAKSFQQKREQISVQAMIEKYNRIAESRRKKNEILEQNIKKYQQLLKYRMNRKLQAHGSHRTVKNRRSKTCIYHSEVNKKKSQNWVLQNHKRYQKMLEYRIKKGSIYIQNNVQRQNRKKQSQKFRQQSLEKIIYWERKLVEKK